MKKLTAIVMAVFLLYSGYVFGTVSAADEIYTTRTVTVYHVGYCFPLGGR